MDSGTVVVVLVVVFALGLIVGTRSSHTGHDRLSLEIIRLLRAVTQLEQPRRKKRKHK